jgi:hypothetical protein
MRVQRLLCEKRERRVGSVEGLTVGVVRALAAYRLDYDRWQAGKERVRVEVASRKDNRINISHQLFGASEANRTVRSCEELFDRGYFAFEIVDPERNEGSVALRLKQWLSNHIPDLVGDAYF